MFNRFWSMAFISLSLVSFMNCSRGLQQAEFASEGPVVQSVDIDHKDRDHDPTAFRHEKIETAAKDLIYDRVLLISHLKSVFGTRVATMDKDRIETDMRTFASPCSAYEQFNDYDEATKKIVNGNFRTCAIGNSASSMKASPFAETSTSRQGTMEHLCRALTADTAARTFALKKLSSDGKPAATKENILKAFRLFYRSAPVPPDSLLQSLQVMVGQEQATSAQWTPVLFTLCVSPGWQVL